MSTSWVAAKLVALSGIAFIAWYAKRPKGLVGNIPEDPPVPTSLDEAKKHLTNWLHAKAEPLPPARRAGERTSSLEGASFEVDARVAGPVLEKLHERWRAAGMYLFQCDRGYGLRPDRIALLPTSDPWTVIRHLGTSAPNYDHGTEDIIGWLQKLAVKQPFQLTAVSGAWVEGRFRDPVRDAAALAREMYEFCPDIVDQGTESVDALAKELEKTRTLYLWWD